MTLPEMIMRDGYVGGIGSASFIPQNPRPAFVDQDNDPVDEDGRLSVQSPVGKSTNPWFNQTDEDKMVRLSCSDPEVKATNINRTEEYNVGYMGLSILPWEDFVFNPRTLNELFFHERTNNITYDPDEVNVFFHGKNVMPPTVGDISENGKSWNIVVDTVNDLRKIRQWLTEKCSVFGVTLVYKEKRFGKSKRVPCLVMLDPSKGALADKLYTTLTRAMDALHRQRRFCVEINLNGCVERWCKRVLMTECKAVGAKLVITNGEEYTNLGGAEDIVCCILCLPLWACQAGIYKLHRKVVYDDFLLKFDADDLFLHGTYQDASCQRQQIFHSAESGLVFRTRSAGQTNITTLQELGSFKFISVKKYKKGNEEKGEEDTRIKEHNTTPFNELIAQRKDKIVLKEDKLLKKKAKSSYPKAPTESQEQPTVSMKKIPRGMEGIPELRCETNTAYEVSDDEISPPPQIPEVSSVFVNQADNQSEVSQDIEEDEHQRLFSPKLKQTTSMSMNNALFDSADFDNSDGAVQKFHNSDDDSVIDDIDSDSDEEQDTVKQKPKEALINEMHKIEQMLPAIQSKSVYEAKDLETMTVEEKSKKEKEEKKKKKKKNKQKPAVGKVLKDLMKTTGKSDCIPSAEDERFQKAMENLNSTKNTINNFKSTSKTEVSNTEIEHNKTLENTDLSVISNLDRLEVCNKPNKYVVEPLEINSPRENLSCDVEQFTMDDSSTDGDDVEMIYQSHRAKHDDTESPDHRQDIRQSVSSVLSVTAIPVNNSLVEDIDDLNTETDDTKVNNGNVLHLNRKAKFNSEKLFSTTSHSPLFSFNSSSTSSNKYPSVFDNAELDDEEESDIEEVGCSVTVKTATGTDTRTSVPPLKLSFESGPSRKQKRGTKQYNSNRKYLGGSVPAAKKKSQKN